MVHYVCLRIRNVKKKVFPESKHLLVGVSGTASKNEAHLCNDAARGATTTAVSINGSRGLGLGLGGDREERYEEIHWESVYYQQWGYG